MKTDTKYWRLPILMAIVLVAGCDAASNKSASDGAKQAPPKPAEVMTIARRDIELNKSYPAKLRSNREAVVIARVQGLLEERLFEPGQQVVEGDSLYTI